LGALEKTASGLSKRIAALEEKANGNDSLENFARHLKLVEEGIFGIKGLKPSRGKGKGAERSN
jgi:hypothetical protein